MNIKVGDIVQVRIDPDDKIPNNPVKKYDGQCFVVKASKTVRHYGTYKRTFELYDCESKFGIPYTFNYEELIKI